VRILCARATVGSRTVLTYILFGALIGPAVVPVMQRFLAPYGWNASSPVGRLVPSIALGVGSEILFLLPIAAYLLRRRTYLASSVHDAFLLAFSAGFGYELLGRVVWAAGSNQKIAGLTLFPPWQMQRPPVTIAGNAYWLALPALALFAGLRFWRGRVAAALLAALFVVIAGVARARFVLDPNQAWPEVLGKISFQGAAFAWFAVLALLATMLAEERWVGRAIGAKVAGLPVLNELGELLKTLSSGGRAGFASKSAAFRRTRQAQIARAESARRPADKELSQTAAELAQRIDAGGAASTGAYRSHRWQAATLALGVFVIVLLPMLPDKVGTFFWSLPILHLPVVSSSQLALIALLPLALIAWRFVASPAAPFSRTDPDEQLQFRGERGLLQACLGFLVIVLVYGKVQEIYTLDRLPSDPSRLTTCILLIAASFATITVRRADRWAAAPVEARRSAAMRQTLKLGIALLGTWCCFAFFAQLQALLHAHGGGVLFNLFGRNGNSAGDTFAAILTIGFSYAIFRLLFKAAAQARRFFGYGRA
jgi:hypothetical protein